MSDRIDPESVRFEASVRTEEFRDWGGPEGVDHFSEAEVVALVTAFTVALDKITQGLTTAAQAIGRAGELYRWVRKKVAGGESPAPAFSPGERILTLLTDASATGRGGMPPARLAAVTGLTVQECEAELRRLAEYGVARQEGENWVFVLP